MRWMNANADHTAASELSREFIAFACELGVLRFGEFRTKAGRLGQISLWLRRAGIQDLEGPLDSRFSLRLIRPLADARE